MTFLLDSHLLIWAAEDDDRLSDKARSLINDPLNDLVFSAASIWELSIKAALAKTGFQVDPRLLRTALLNAGFRELPVTSEHALTIQKLPPIHRDPFDRILIAQAQSEQFTLLTVDTNVARYPGPILKL